jgi:hypothetical protein
VSHILVDCPRYGEAHRLYHHNGALQEIFGDSNVIAFLNTVGATTAIYIRPSEFLKILNYFNAMLTIICFRVFCIHSTFKSSAHLEPDKWF